MLHLTLAANVLNAVGGTPDLTGAGLRADVPGLPARRRGRLRGRPAGASPGRRVETFLKIERPRERARRASPGCSTAARRQRSRLRASARRRPSMHFYSIGEFYEEIGAGCEHLHERDWATSCSPATRPGRSTPSTTTPAAARSSRCTDLASARAAIELIAEQGEGLGGGIYDDEGELAHYYRFQQLLLGRYYQPGDAAGRSRPGRRCDVDWDAVYPVKTNAPARRLPARAPSCTRAARGVQPAATRTSSSCSPSAYNGRPELLHRRGGRDVPPARRDDPPDAQPDPGPGRAQRRADVRDGAAVAAAAGAMTRPDRLERFLAFSAAVTAFTRLRAARAPDRPRTYLATVADVVGDDVLDELLDDLDARARRVARRTTAGLAGPAAPRSSATSARPGRPQHRSSSGTSASGTSCRRSGRTRTARCEKDVTFTVSAAAYTEGLLWPAIGANPPGRQGARATASWAGPPRIPAALRPPTEHQENARDRSPSKLDRDKVQARHHPDAVVERRLPLIDIGISFGQCVSEMALAGFQGCSVGHKYPTDTAVLKRELDLRGLRVSEPWASTYFTINDMEEHDARSFHAAAGVHQGDGRHRHGRRRARRGGAPAAGGGVRQPADLRRRAVGGALPRAQPARRDRRRRGDAALLPPPHGHRRDDARGDSTG